MRREHVEWSGGRLLRIPLTVWSSVPAGRPVNFPVPAGCPVNFPVPARHLRFPSRKKLDLSQFILFGISWITAISSDFLYANIQIKLRFLYAYTDGPKLHRLPFPSLVAVVLKAFIKYHALCLLLC